MLTAAPAGLYLVRRPVPLAQVSFSEFVQRVESGNVTDVNVGERELIVTLRDGSKVTTVAPQGFLAANSTFVTDMVKRQIKVDVAPIADPTSLSWSAIMVAAAFLGLLGFTVYRTTSGKIPSISARARVADQGGTVITFQDVAGVDEAKDEV